MPEINFLTLLEQQIAGNTVQKYLEAFFIFFLFVLFLYLFKFLLVNRLRNIVSKTTIKFDDLLVDVVRNNLKWPLMLVLGLNLGLRKLIVPEVVMQIVNIVTIIIASYYLIRFLSDLISYFSRTTRIRLADEGKGNETSIIRMLERVAKASLWVIATIVVLQSLGVNVSALVAGVGVGGIAIAFALQSILEDVFASISLHFDKPFKVGDFILIGDEVGSVKSIGLKTSRIKTLRGEELAVPNKELALSKVNNFSRMNRRRVDIDFGIIYETPLEKVKKVKLMVEKIVEELEDVTLDRVHFKELGEYSLNYEVIFHIEDSDYNLYMDRREEFNTRLMEEFEEMGIEFAYPTQAVLSHDENHLAKMSV